MIESWLNTKFSKQKFNIIWLMAFHIKIGNYRFSKNLGKGSFGKVKRA